MTEKEKMRDEIIAKHKVVSTERDAMKTHVANVLNHIEKTGTITALEAARAYNCTCINQTIQRINKFLNGTDKQVQLLEWRKNIETGRRYGVWHLVKE
jgi:hypothetical protein